MADEPNNATARTSMVNGIWTLTLPLADRGLAYGDGLFETCRWYQGRIPLWQWHRARLLNHCPRLSLNLDSQRLEQEFEAFCSELRQNSQPDGIVKLILTRGQGGQGYVPLTNPTTNLIWQYFPLPAAANFRSGGVNLIAASAPIPANRRLAGIKHLNRLDYVLAAADQKLADDECLLLMDEQRCVLEALHQNIFWLQDGTLLTPSLAQAGVAGVMRQVVIERFAPQLGIKVQEVSMSADVLLDAKEVFLCNALRGIWPVKQFASVTWSSWPLVKQLQHMEQSLWQSA